MKIMKTKTIEKTKMITEKQLKNENESPEM